MILKHLSSCGLLPVSIISVKKWTMQTLVYWPLFIKNSGNIPSNRGAFAGFTALSATETSSQEQGRENSVFVTLDFRVLSSRFTLIVCASSCSAPAVTTSYEIMEFG